MLGRGEEGDGEVKFSFLCEKEIHLVGKSMFIGVHGKGQSTDHTSLIFIAAVCYLPC